MKKWMKVLTAVLLAATLCLSLTGCAEFVRSLATNALSSVLRAAVPEEYKEAIADAVQAGDGLTSADGSESGTGEIVEDAIPENAPEDIEISDGDVPLEVRLYQCKTGFDDPYCPTLVLQDNGDFTFAVNLGEGMGMMAGRFITDEDWIICSVDTCDFTGFAGEDVKEITFRSESDGSLTLDGADTMIGLSFGGDVFELVQ